MNADRVEQTHKLAAKMQRGYFKDKVLKPKNDYTIVEAVPGPSRHLHKSKRLTLAEKYEVVYAVLIGHEFQADVAR